MTDKKHTNPKKKSAAAQREAKRRNIPREPETRFETLIAVLVIVLAIVVLYPGHVFQDKIFFAGDTEAAASFAAAAEKAMTEENVYPVWNPYLFAGMPSYGSLSFTPYVYPPSAVLKLLVKYLFFPKYIWLFFHTFLAGFGTYLLLRGRKVWFLPALSAGVLMMWMPNLVAVGANGHGSQACAVGYIPFALLFWDRIWRGKGIVINGAALIIVLGFSMLRGHLQISYYTYALIALHLLFFGVARIADGIEHKAPAFSALPRRMFAKLTGGGERYSVGSAIVEFVWGAAILCVVAGVSLLISYVLHIPAHDYAQHSIRGASITGGLDYGYATSWSLHPLEMATFVLPYSFGFGKDLYFGHMPFTDYPNYVGLVVLMCAVVAMIKARSRFLWFLIFVSVVATLVSFGKFFPVLYNPLFKWAPYFDKFRVPVMVLIVQQFAFVLMFGIGFDALIKVDPEKGKRNAVTGLAIAFLVFMIVILSQNFWSGGFAESIASDVRSARTPQEQIAVARVVGNYLFNDLVKFSVMLASVFAIMFLYYNRKLPARVFCILLLVVGLVDFYLVDKNILHPEEFRKHEQLRIIHDRSVVDRYKKSDGMIEFLKSEQRHFRVFPMDHPRNPFSSFFQSNRFMVFGISSIGGYHPAKLSLYDEFIRTFPRALARGNLQVLDMLNVRYLICGAELPTQQSLAEVWRGTDYEDNPRYIYENPGVFPRAWLVGAHRVVPPEASLDLVISGSVDLSREVILVEEPSVAPAVPAGDDSVRAVVEKLGFNEIRVRTNARSPSILVLSEIYYPDWTVEVDGAPGKLLRANHILRAVALDGGEHEVVFRYDTSLIARSAYVSATTLGLVMLILVAGLVLTIRGRKSGSTRRRADV